MLPLKDENPTARTAWMTISLIVVNILVFFLETLLPEATGRQMVLAAGFVPGQLSGATGGDAIPVLSTLVTSQFLHGGWLHLGGNMLFLWIFGNNVEDEFGPFRFLAFYLLCGIIAGLTHFLTEPSSPIPTIGASGAISGVLGAYALLFPGARIYTLVVLIIYITIVPIPAVVWVAIWLILQLVQGFLSLGSQSGVAWFAHIGGLAGGVILFLFFRRSRPKSTIEPFSGTWSRS